MIDTLINSASSRLVQSTLFGGAAALLTVAFRANRSTAKKAALAIAGAAVLMAPVLVDIANAPAILAQIAPGDTQWEAAAGGHMAFEVASVKLLKPGSRFRAPNFPLGGDGFRTDSGENPHGRLSVAFPLPRYIEFAYKLTLQPDLRQEMVARLPKWVDTDFVDIEAKAAGNPTKDQMRLMMQSLLTERFHLAVHYETQDVPIYALTLTKPGKWGPKLIRHADGPPCAVSGHQNPATGRSDPGAAVFPTDCESDTSVTGKNGRIVQGSRNTTMALLAESLGRMGGGGRPVVDRTGITDRIDYRLEWTLESKPVCLPGPCPGIPGVEVEPDPNPVTFMDAVRDQLGLKLQSTKAPLRILVIDHIERPSEN
jgi:bla regulator protein BlaR1